MHPTRSLPLGVTPAIMPSMSRSPLRSDPARFKATEATLQGDHAHGAERQ